MYIYIAQSTYDDTLLQCKEKKIIINHEVENLKTNSVVDYH